MRLSRNVSEVDLTEAFQNCRDIIKDRETDPVILIKHLYLVIKCCVFENVKCMVIN